MATTIAKLQQGQYWTNDYTNTQVYIKEVTDTQVVCKTPSGFEYTYPMAQFLKEYSNGNEQMATFTDLNRD